MPYSYGGVSPASGFDCSGFTRFVFAHFGVTLPHYTFGQYDLGRSVSRGALEPGDLVFFDGVGHVGLYIGRGRFIHAPHSGTRVFGRQPLRLVRGPVRRRPQSPLTTYDDAPAERLVRPVVMDRPILHALVERLREQESLQSLARSLPTRARVSEPVLPLVLAALHEELGRGLDRRPGRGRGRPGRL